MKHMKNILLIATILCSALVGKSQDLNAYNSSIDVLRTNLKKKYKPNEIKGYGLEAFRDGVFVFWVEIDNKEYLYSRTRPRTKCLYYMCNKWGYFEYIPINGWKDISQWCKRNLFIKTFTVIGLCPHDVD